MIFIAIWLTLLFAAGLICGGVAIVAYALRTWESAPPVSAPPVVVVVKVEIKR